MMAAHFWVSNLQIRTIPPLPRWHDAKMQGELPKAYLSLFHVFKNLNFDKDHHNLKCLAYTPIPNVKKSIYLESCCCAYLSSGHRTASDANLSDDPHTFHYNDYFAIGRIRTCLGVSDDPMFLRISSNSCQMNLLLVRSHQAEIIIVKHIIQRHNNVMRVRVEPTPFDQGRRKNDAFTHSATLPTKYHLPV